MSLPSSLYRPALGLLTDLYELTMASAAWRSGAAEREGTFHLYFRRTPFGSGYAVACGLAHAVDYITSHRFDPEDLAYLQGLRDGGGGPLFEPAFLDYLGGLALLCDVDAIPEGRVVFPNEPLMRVQGPFIACVLLESALLNIINFQTLIATKAARICEAARGAPVLEFGLRRAQGIDGALAASRAAHIGGCAATSNVLAGRLLDIPVRGTHAHSWVMLFDDEPAAFRAYAEAQPGNCVFLVDTYDTLRGVQNAIEAGHALRERGHELAGIRLDSGDLAYLSIAARRLLDEAGFPGVAIIASNDLDEHVIGSLREQGAAITMWGVGTRLITAFEEAALGGVYKLSAVRVPGGAWRPRIKLSEQAAKVSTPGVLQVRRYLGPDGATLLGDLIYDEELGPASRVIIDPLDPTRSKEFAEHAAHEDLLVPVVRGGRRVGESPTIAAIRERARAEIARLHPGIRRFKHPHQYPVGLERGLHALKTRMILAAREQSRPP
ncbi:MAG: nicotinate phosphoribosyltransferase [Myxococcales bacterium]|nr:nicotinate phosphoribosyltransferase [Myxococcales bacterium]